jgi:hypothetical protein
VQFHLERTDAKFIELQDVENALEEMLFSGGSLEDWGKLIGDVPSATAILDRFLHHAEIITITGRSYRLRNQGSKDGQPAENDQPSKEREGKRSRREPADPPSAE